MYMVNRSAVFALGLTAGVVGLGIHNQRPAPLSSLQEGRVVDPLVNGQEGQLVRVRVEPPLSLFGREFSKLADYKTLFVVGDKAILCTGEPNFAPNAFRLSADILTQIAAQPREQKPVGVLDGTPKHPVVRLQNGVTAYCRSVFYQPFNGINSIVNAL